VNPGRYGILVVLAVVCLFGVARYPIFFTPENVLNVLRQHSMLALVALGMTAVILTGGIDLSVGSLLAVGGLVAAALSTHGAAVAAGVGVGAAALLGLVNGLVITRVRVPAFVVTLAMMIAARGAVLGVTGEASVRVAPAATDLIWLGRGWLGPVPAPVALFAAAYALGWLVLRYTTFGRHMYAVGDNEDAARLLGLRVDRVLLGTHALSGALAGLAGVVLAARLGAGQPVAGIGWELDAIAAVVVGGTLLTGGQGGVGHTLVGVVLLGVILNLLNLEGTLSPWWQWMIRGLFLLAVVAVQARASRHASRGA
jgi:ribose transport system permease protein